MEPIILVFALKGDFGAHLAVTLQSIFETNKGEKFEIIALIYEVSEDDQAKIIELVENWQSSIRLVPVEISQFLGLPVAFHLDLSSYFRLLIPQIVSGNKALYLDSDLVVAGPLRPLWEIDLRENVIGVVADFCGKSHPELPINPEIGYCNTGIMLMNLERWRIGNLPEKVLDFARNNPSFIRFADQCGINAICKDHIYLLGPEYNFQGIYYESSYKKPIPYSKEQMENARENPVVIHFVGSKKPWHWGCKHPEKRLYWKYLRKTPFKRYFPENMTLLNVMREFAPKAMIDFFYKKKNIIKNQLK